MNNLFLHADRIGFGIAIFALAVVVLCVSAYIISAIEVDREMKNYKKDK